MGELWRNVVARLRQGGIDAPAHDACWLQPEERVGLGSAQPLEDACAVGRVEHLSERGHRRQSKLPTLPRQGQPLSVQHLPTWPQADVDIGGVSVRWRYKDFGTRSYDQCMELASRAGASITTPDTLGITWPSGTKYWLPSGLMCNTYWFMSASQSGTSNTFDGRGAYVRSISGVSCLAAFIEYHF